MSEAASPATLASPSSPDDAADSLREGELHEQLSEAAAAVAAAAGSPGLLPAIGEELSMGVGLAALAGDKLEGGSDDSDYEQDDYEQLDLGALLLETNLREEVQRLLARIATPRRLLLRDKITFVLGVMSLVLGAYFLGYSPQTFYRLYTIEGIALLALRLAHYRWKRWHYYAFDWCYAVNALLMIHIWSYPTNLWLAKVMFAHAFGPLLWSILAWRNSIVPHSLDKMTSHFMHLYPACVCWTLRWHTPDPLAAHLAASPRAAAAWEAGGLRDLVLYPVLPYLAWAVLYYLKVFVISKKKVEQKGYETLFQFSTRSRRSLFGAVVLRAPPALQPLVYMCLHLALTTATLLFNLLWWRSYAANTAFLVLIFTASAWTGACYYFDYFLHRYLASVGLKEAIRRGTSEAPSQSTASDAKKVR